MSYNFARRGHKIEIKNPILIAGLPGIGNVGKIAVDFLIEEMKAKKIYNSFGCSCFCLLFGMQRK